MNECASGLRVRELALGDLTSSALKAWSLLEARAAEPNAFLSPHFVLPALRHLDADLRPIVLVVETSRHAGADMLALGVFTGAAASSLCPLPQLIGYCSRHSYLGGLLVARDHVRDAVAALYAHARGRSFGWQALVLPKARTDGPVAAMFEEQALEAGMVAHRLSPRQRAILLPAAAGVDALRQALGKHLKAVERSKRRLMERGDVTWHCLREQVDAGTVESFLRLEHQGWKADTASSLRAAPADEAFFKEAVGGFSGDRRALFTELRVGDRAIASTSNFVSGGAGFAFKLGWDADLRKFGPGILNETEFVRAAPDVCADLEWFDSGAAPDSFICQLWRERRELAALVVPLTRLADLSLRATGGLRRAAQRLRAHSVASTTPHDATSSAVSASRRNQHDDLTSERDQ